MSDDEKSKVKFPKFTDEYKSDLIKRREELETQAKNNQIKRLNEIGASYRAAESVFRFQNDLRNDEISDRKISLANQEKTNESLEQLNNNDQLLLDEIGGISSNVDNINSTLINQHSMISKINDKLTPSRGDIIFKWIIFVATVVAAIFAIIAGVPIIKTWF